MFAKGTCTPRFIPFVHPGVLEKTGKFIYLQQEQVNPLEGNTVVTNETEAAYRNVVHWK